MNKLKKSLTLILFVFITLTFGGCATIEYSRTIQPSGRVTDRLVIAVSEDALSNSNMPAEELFANIKSDLEEIYLKPINNFKNMYEQDTEISTEEKLEVLEGISASVTQEGNEIICEVVFSNMRVFELYYKPSGENQIELVNGVFINKYVQSSNNAFSILKSEQFSLLIEKYRNIFNGTYNVEDLKLSQVYASPNTTIYSNANQTKTEQGIKSHMWEINSANLDFNLEFYTVSPRTTSWYILALVASIVVAAVLWVVFKIKDKQK